MVSLSVIILTLNEELDIARCISSVMPVAKNVYVVDSFSTDATVSIAESLGAKVYQRKWKNYSDQFQWALDNLPIDTAWVMRLDGNEYIEQPLQDELIERLPSVSDDINGIYLKMKIYFQGEWIRYGGKYPLVLMRMWRVGKGRIESRWMDEHMVLSPGSKTMIMKNDMADDNRKGLSFWIEKHNSYASREAVDVLNTKYHLFESDNSMMETQGGQARIKRILKEKVYASFPLGLRAFLYFMFRYLFRFGFLDGANGFVFHFMQAFWYRLLVDLKVSEIEKHAHGDVAAIKRELADKHGIRL